MKIDFENWFSFFVYDVVADAKRWICLMCLYFKQIDGLINQYKQ